MKHDEMLWLIEPVQLVDVQSIDRLYVLYHCACYGDLVQLVQLYQPVPFVLNVCRRSPTDLVGL